MTPLEIAQRARSILTGYSTERLYASKPTEHGRDNHAVFTIEDLDTGEMFTVEVSLAYQPITCPGSA